MQALHVAAVAALPDVAFAFVEVLVAGRFAGRAVFHQLRSSGRAFVVVVAGIVGRIAVAETLGEDLVPDGVLGPVGRDERAASSSMRERLSALAAACRHVLRCRRPVRSTYADFSHRSVIRHAEGRRIPTFVPSGTSAGSSSRCRRSAVQKWTVDRHSHIARLHADAQRARRRRDDVHVAGRGIEDDDVAR